MSGDIGQARREGAIDDLLVRVAWFYYKDDMTQEEIARQLSLSRASVGRMLDRARKLGVVTIGLNAAHLAGTELSSRLRTAFGLTDALVVPGPIRLAEDPGAARRVGLGAAQMLASHLANDVSVGVGFGRSVTEVIRAASYSTLGRVRFVAMTGGVSGYVEPFASPSPEMVGADLDVPAVVPAPLITTTAALASSLLKEPAVAAMLAEARAVEIAVIGIGALHSGPALQQMGGLHPDDVDALERLGAVGDMLGQFFDQNGDVVDAPLHRRRIGIDLDDLGGIRRVIGVAGGLDKLDAIQGALRGSHLDVLVTDEPVAQALLAAASMSVLLDG